MQLNVIDDGKQYNGSSIPHVVAEVLKVCTALKHGDALSVREMAGRANLHQRTIREWLHHPLLEKFSIPECHIGFKKIGRVFANAKTVKEYNADKHSKQA